APHPELDAVVQRVGQAFVPHRAAPADPLRHVLLSTLHEQRVRVPVPARRHAGPVGHHPHVPRPPLYSPMTGRGARPVVRAAPWSPSPRPGSFRPFRAIPPPTASSSPVPGTRTVLGRIIMLCSQT